MKRLRSSDDLDSFNEKSGSMKDSNRSSSSSRSFYYKPADDVRKGLISPSSSSGRYDRDRSVLDEDINNGSRDGSRMVRKRPDHDFYGFERRKGVGLGFDRYNNGIGGAGSGGGGAGGGREGYAGAGGMDRSIHRSESFCGPRRDFPKGFRSERDRSRREGSVSSSWRRFGSAPKEFEEIRGNRGGNEERLFSGMSRLSPKVLKDVRSPTWSRESGSEQMKMGRDSGSEQTKMGRDSGSEQMKAGRDSGSEQTRVLRGWSGGRDEQKGGGGRSSTSKSRSSPTWSKDSESPQSKSVEVEGKKNVEIDGKKGIEVDGKKGIEVDGKKGIEVDGKKGIEIDGRKSIEVDGKKSMEVDGKKSIIIVDGKKSIKVDGKKSIKVDGRKSVEVADRKSVEVDGKKSVEVVKRKIVKIEARKSAEPVGKKSMDVEVIGKSVIMVERKNGGSRSSSEIEEGELQPEEPQIVCIAVSKESDSDNANEKQGAVEKDDDSREIVSEIQVKDQVNEGGEVPHTSRGVLKEADEKPNFEENQNSNNSGIDTPSEAGNVHHDEESDSLKEKKEQAEERVHDVLVEESFHLERESKPENGLELKVEDQVPESNEEVIEENGGLQRNTDAATESLFNLKDKGKSLAFSPTNDPDLGKENDLELKVEDRVPDSNEQVIEENGGLQLNTDAATKSLFKLKDKGKSLAFSPTNDTEYGEHEWIVRESKNVPSCTDEEDNMEGPSTRGFELFSSSPVRKVEKAEQSGVSKPKDEKLVLEPLDLSLSLPNVLLPVGANKETNQAPGSPSHGRSFQSFSSFCTNSDGFTGSMSFSGSQSFFHNPSCSLTQNSMDMDNYEQSVHSRPIFQGIDQSTWQGPSQGQGDLKHKDIPLYQRILMNGNGSLHQPRASQGMSGDQVLPISSKKANVVERQLSFHKHLPGGQGSNHHDGMRSPSQSVGSHDIGSSYSVEKKRAMREKHSGNLYRSNSQTEQEKFPIGGPDFVETVIGRIVSDPIHVVAKKFNEMTSQSASCLKESIRELMLNADKQGQLCAFQSLLQSRSDLTLELLLKAHRSQLEILVALKTGLWEYLQVDSSFSSSDLAEVFLNSRCRNLTCRSPLPVDECDCKVCAKRTGFCSSCMCLVCSKFDMASNTCSWVGCDVCLHWCHADCALRESYIRNGKSATSSSQGVTEMQFHCVACDHPSEMFGFVKEVFLNFAKEWTADKFCSELEYVKRIFRAGKDVRGRQLHEIAHQMLAKLANKSTLPEVYSHIMSFLTESDSSKFGNSPVFSGKEQGNGSSSAVAGSSQDVKWHKSVYTEKAAPPQLERSVSLLPSYHSDLNDKRPAAEPDLIRSSQKEPLFDELESIVRIKVVEAKMFQGRADDARRDSEGLRQIANAKKEKIEEEYSSRILKLRITEAEETRKQKLEEFQTLERAHREYLNMKIRMEADIKDLLLKMEATKRNLSI